MVDNVKRNRSWAYNILINEFEPTLRKLLIDKILIPCFGTEGWKEQIPQKIFLDLEETGKQININDINSVFEELYLISLKEISINTKIYPLCKGLIYNDISKDIFISKFDELNDLRNKIAHAKSSFSDYDLENLIENLETVCSKESFSDFLLFLRNESYKTSDYISIPENFYKQTTCIHNLPAEDYELDGGYIGRKKEINEIKKKLYSDLDRVISITGAGGLGKTALALKVAYSILMDDNSNYKYIIWFSAKENKLTPEDGIVDIQSQITDYTSLLRDIADVLNIEYDEDYEDYDIKEEVYKHFSENKCLLVIDNLETITDTNIITFIKDLPRPSQILITSRKGLGEIERRYELTDFPVESAVQLFRIIAKEKDKKDLVSLPNSTIENLVQKVKCYPLLIKWSIGKTCLGMDINKAFDAIYSGKSEISQFVFNDIFALFSENAKQLLYAMIVYGDKPISIQMLKHFVNFDDDDFEDTIRDLVNCSFIKSEAIDNNGQLTTHYNMLFLTRGFVQTKLDECEDPARRFGLQKILHEINVNAEETIKSFNEYNKSLASFGIQTQEDKLAYNYIKIAKNFLKQDNIEAASKNFYKALEISPNLIYALNETAKFEASICHIEEAEALFKKGIKINKNSLILSSYGIFLRKNDRATEAIGYFKQALGIDPSNANILTELGRALSFTLNFQEADEQYEKALQLQKLDFKQKRVAMYYKADNYHRWGETFLSKGDINSNFHYINLGLDLVNQCLEMNRYDKQVKTLKSKITKDLGIIYLKLEKLKEAEESFDEVMEMGIIHDECIVIKELFKYYKRQNNNFQEQIKTWIKKLPIQNLQPKEEDEIKRLKDFVNQKKSKKIGIIRFIHLGHLYGVIDYGQNESCTFKLKNASFYVDDNNKKDFEGKNVSFELKQYQDKLIAIHVDLEES